MESKNFDDLRNFGISGNIFNLNPDSNNQTDVYIIKQEKIKKNFSEGAICKIPGSYLNLSIPKAKDDMELYDECDQEYAVFGGASNQKERMGCDGQLGANFHSAVNSNFSSMFDNYNDLNAKKSNFIVKNFSNFSTCSNFTNSFGAWKSEESEGIEAKCPKSQSVQTFFANENCEKKVNNFQCENIGSKEYAYNKNNLYQNQNILNDDQKTKGFLSKNNTFQANNLKEKENEKLKETENNYLNENSEEELKNGIFKNSVQNQMEQLNRIFQEMNQSSEAKVIIKAYKSKLKTKFYKIYESNSQFYKEKNKYKIFHKCNFPGCSRTFASAGWLKSHFNEHLQEMKSNKFNLEFERSLMKLKHMNLLK